MTDRTPVSDLAGMLSGMRPVLDERGYAFALLADGEAVLGDAFAIVREDEGVTAICPATGGAARFARITLTVHSALDGVGLTAAVSSSLAAKGIACNVIAGFHHDHLFVPWERRVEALGILDALSHDARR